MNGSVRVFALCAVLAGGFAALRAVGAVTLLVEAPAAAAPEAPEAAAPPDENDDSTAGAPAGDGRTAQAPPAPAASCPPSSIAQRAGVSNAELRVLASLAERREALEARETEFAARAALLDAAEMRLEERVAELKALRADVERLLGQLDVAEQRQVESLVALYTAMKAKDAARILPGLEEDVRVAVAAQMPERALSAVLAAMGQDEAVALTMLLARRHDKPDAVRAKLLDNRSP